MATSPPGNCYFGIPATAPPAWLLPNATLAACSIPYCGNTTAILSQCCDKPPSSFVNYTRDDREYLTCELDESKTGTDWLSSRFQDAYQDFKNCIVQNEGNRILCNRPGQGTSGYCPSRSLTPPAPPSNGGAMVCGMRTSRNATNTLRTCCGRDNIQVYIDGCFSSCEGDAELHNCLQSNFPGDGGTPAIVCTRNGENAAVRSATSFAVLGMAIMAFAVAFNT